MSLDFEPSQDQESVYKKELPKWLSATLQDAIECDFEVPIANSTTAECHDLCDLYRTALNQSEGVTSERELASRRVQLMLLAICEMHFKPKERQEPFGPMVVFANGDRSATASDFRENAEIIAHLANRATNPVLRARLCDLSWLLQKSRGQLALNAIAAYVEIVEKSESGELKYRFAAEGSSLHHGSHEYLQRALHIGQATGWNKHEISRAKELLKRLRKQAVSSAKVIPVIWFCNLDLNYSVSNTTEIGRELDELLNRLPVETYVHNVVDVWKLAARAFHVAKLEDDKNRCLGEAAERLALEASAKQNSAMLSSHFLSSAIAQLHGIPAKKERRNELRHSLIDVQARISDEMSVFSHELDLTDLAAEVQGIISRANVLDMFFIFADLAKSPDTKKLREDALSSIQRHPMSSMFGSSHMDRAGKVIHRSQGAGFDDEDNSSAILEKISQNDTSRRQVVAFGQIEPARHKINEIQYLSDSIFISIIQHSPFIPNELILTFARGFSRFFQGDFISALYILTPLLENSIRYVLKQNGVDVTKFDDATQTQQDMNISSIFEQKRPELESILTTNITADIERLFLIKPGPHLRHAVAHGLLYDGDPFGADAIYACWMIFRLTLLPLFKHRKNIEL